MGLEWARSCSSGGGNRMSPFVCSSPASGTFRSMSARFAKKHRSGEMK